MLLSFKCVYLHNICKKRISEQNWHKLVRVWITHPVTDPAFFFEVSSSLETTGNYLLLRTQRCTQKTLDQDHHFPPHEFSSSKFTTFTVKTLEVRFLNMDTSFENITFCIKIIIKSLLALELSWCKQNNKNIMIPIGSTICYLPV